MCIRDRPTIDEKWGDYEQVENLQTFEMEGLQTIKCFGSSKAFSAKMQTVPGVYGVKTFVRRHGVEVLFDPAKTDTLKIQAAIFAPTLRKYAMPGENVPMLDVVKLGVEAVSYTHLPSRAAFRPCWGDAGRAACAWSSKRRTMPSARTCVIRTRGSTSNSRPA